MRAILALTAAALLAGCAHGGTAMNDGTSATPPKLAGTSWSIANINGAPPTATRATEVRFSEDRISGNAGCNSFGGGYTIAGDVMTATQVISTKMACVGDSMDQESAFFKILGQPMTMTWQDDGSLTLSDDAGSATLTRGK
ncbi:MAG: META domain-containing protein [Sphingomonas sp.]